MGPLFEAFPAAGILFAVNGFETGIEEIRAGQGFTATFDIISSIAPFLFKGNDLLNNQFKQISQSLAADDLEVSPVQQGSSEGYQITKPFGQGTGNREQGTARIHARILGKRATKFIYEKK